MKEFVTIVLVIISMIVLGATPYAFFFFGAIAAGQSDASRDDAWLTLLPAVAIILLWTVIIRALRRHGR